jgi:restriction endonuclease Mrr
MPRGTRKLQINRQQKHILLLALFLLKYAHGKPHPLKRHVIGFIDTKNLITIRPEDRKIVATGEEAWENSIAFRRADLKAEGCLTMPDIGVWQITPAGERRLIEWCAVMNEFVALHPDWEKRLDSLEDFFEEKVVITKDAVLAAQSAFGIAKRLFPHAVPEISPEMRGRIRL